MSANFRVEQLSGPAERVPWTVCVFAHNEAAGIGTTLRSIESATDGKPTAIYVLANGCTDTTAAEVRAASRHVSDLYLMELDIADKANAWNVFVHEVSPGGPGAGARVHFFMDGDVTLEPRALAILATVLDTQTGAHAAGALPACGRDRDAWRGRMIRNGMLAGNCYGLRGEFVAALRAAAVRIPVGLVGEDFLVSWLVSHGLDTGGEDSGLIRSVFHPDAQFSFRSLSPWRWRDYRTYVRRKWRYACRAIQHRMLIPLLRERGLGAMPRDVNGLYAVGPLPSRLVWEGRETPLRLLALLLVRSRRKRARRAAGLVPEL